jgi:hypothetical protein
MALKEVIRELVTRLGYEVDDSGARAFDEQAERIKRGMADTAGRVRLLAAQIGASLAAAFGINAARAFISEQQEAIKQLEIYSTAINASTDETQRLAFAARELGVDFDDITQGAIDLADRLGDAAINGGENAESFNRLGISFRDSSGQIKSGIPLLLETVDALRAMPSEAQRTELAMTLFGDAGGRMARIIEGGSEAIRDLASQADAAGAVISREQIDTMQRLSEAQRRVSDATRALALQFLTRIIPAVTDASQALAAFLRDGERVEALLEFMRKALARVGAVLAARQLFRLGQSLVALPGLLAQAGRAALGAARGFSLLQASVAALPIAAGAFLLFLQDASVLLAGGDSILGRFIGRFAEADGVMGTVARTLQSLVPIAAQLFDSLKGAATQILPALMASVQRLAPVLLQVFSTLVNSILPPVLEVLGEVIKAVQEIAPSIMELVLTAAMLFAQLVQAVRAPLAAILDAVVRLAGAVLPIIKGGLTFLVSLLTAIIPVVARVASAALGVITTLVSLLGPLFEGLLAVVQPIAETILGWINGLLDLLEPLLSLLGDAASAASSLPGLGGGEERRGLLSSITPAQDMAQRAQASQSTTNNRGGDRTNNATVNLTLNGTGFTPGEAQDVGASLVGDVFGDLERRATARELF